MCEFSTLLWKCHVHVGYIKPITVNYLAHRNWPPYFIHRNSAMTALSPWRNKHGVVTHHVSLHSHFFTLSSDTSALFHIQISALLKVCADRGRCVQHKYGTGSQIGNFWGHTVLSVLSLHVLNVLIVVALKLLTDSYFPFGAGKDFRCH